MGGDLPDLFFGEGVPPLSSLPFPSLKPAVHPHRPRPKSFATPPPSPPHPKSKPGGISNCGERGGYPPKFFCGRIPTLLFPSFPAPKRLRHCLPHPKSNIGVSQIGGGRIPPIFEGLSPFFPLTFSPKNGVSLSPRPRTHLGGSAAREGPGAFRRAPGVAPGVPPGSGLRGARGGGVPRARGGRGAGNRKAPSSHSPPDAPVGKKAGKKRWEKWGGNLGKTGIWARGAPRGGKKRASPSRDTPEAPGFEWGEDCANCPNCWGFVIFGRGGIFQAGDGSGGGGQGGFVGTKDRAPPRLLPPPFLLCVTAATRFLSPRELKMVGITQRGRRARQRHPGIPGTAGSGLRGVPCAPQIPE